MTPVGGNFPIAVTKESASVCYLIAGRNHSATICPVAGYKQISSICNLELLTLLPSETKMSADEFVLNIV